MSGPDLLVFTLKFHSDLALKKTGFYTFSDSKKDFQKFFYKIIMQLFSADAIVFSKEF